MFKKCLVCFGLFSGAALAAEHSAHEPIVSIDQEPSHRLVLKSDSIRVFDVSFPSGKTSLWHSHEKDSVLFCLDGAEVPSEEPGKELVPRPPIPSGFIYYRPYASTPFVHRIRNASTTDFRILDIEVLSARPVPVSLATLDKSLAVVLENDRVRVSKASIKPAHALEQRFAGPHLLVASNGGDFDVESPAKPPIKVAAKRGHLHMEENAQEQSIRNAGREDLEVVIVEVK